MKIYLASPFFQEEEIKVYDRVIEILRRQNLDVFVPREHEIPNGWDIDNQHWAECVFVVDRMAIEQCDVVVVLNFGMYSDSGTAWECGYAYAKGKRVINVLCGDEEMDYSLMMLNGTDIVIPLADFESTPFSSLLEMDRELNKTVKQK